MMNEHNSLCVAHKRGKRIPKTSKIMKTRENRNPALEWAAFTSTKKNTATWSSRSTGLVYVAVLGTCAGTD